MVITREAENQYTTAVQGLWAKVQSILKNYTSSMI